MKRCCQAEVLADIRKLQLVDEGARGEASRIARFHRSTVQETLSWTPFSELPYRDTVSQSCRRAETRTFPGRIPNPCRIEIEAHLTPGPGSIYFQDWTD